LVGYPAEEEGVGLGDDLGGVTVQGIVRDHYPMIAAPVQGDVDGVPKGSHQVRVPIAIGLLLPRLRSSWLHTDHVKKARSSLLVIGGLRALRWADALLGVGRVQRLAHTLSQHPGGNLGRWRASFGYLGRLKMRVL
jgi:hypothetical protein